MYNSHVPVLDYKTCTMLEEITARESLLLFVTIDDPSVIQLYRMFEGIPAG